MSMSVNQRASTITPLLIRVAARSSRSFPVPLSRRHPAVAILVPFRSQSTETTTSGGNSSFPPPGFNSEQAKKATPGQENKQAQSKEALEAQKSDTLRHLHPTESAANVPSNEPSAIPKTEASDAASLNELALAKATADKEVIEKDEKKKKEEKKLTMWQKVKKEAAHYWDGTKLLGAEIKISSKLALKMAAGYELTRREHRQVIRHMFSTLLSPDTCVSYTAQSKISVD